MRGKKESGIRWIGSIPKEWDVLAIKYVFSLSKEIVDSSSTQTQLLSLTKNGIRKILPEQQLGKVPTTFDTYQRVHKDDIVMCLFDLDVSAVFSGISLFDGMISPAYKCFRCKPNILPLFADYYFQCVFDGRKYMRYAKNVRYSLNAEEFLALKILVPTIGEQQSIVDYLNLKCQGIMISVSKLLAEINTMEKYKQSVISEAVTKGINSKATMCDSGMGWVAKLPSHWSRIPSKYLFRDSDLRRQNGDKLLTASQKYGIISQEEYMERENAKIVLANKGLEDWKHVEPNDFVISLRSFQGGLEMSEVTGCVTWHYVVLKARKTIYPKFYKWLFKSSMYITALQRTCNFIRDGQDLRYSNFSQVPLYEPPLEEQKAIADYLDDKCARIDAIIAAKRVQLAKLDAYKKSLIFEYVTGKKEVPNDEQGAE